MLTKDSVTVSVDGVVYYRVQNAILAVANITNADAATRLLAQTTLRNVLGTKSLAEILSDREEIAHSMQVNQHSTLCLTLVSVVARWYAYLDSTHLCLTPFIWHFHLYKEKKMPVFGVFVVWPTNEQRAPIFDLSLMFFNNHKSFSYSLMRLSKFSWTDAHSSLEISSDTGRWHHKPFAQCLLMYRLVWKKLTSTGPFSRRWQLEMMEKICCVVRKINAGNNNRLQ